MDYFEDIWELVKNNKIAIVSVLIGIASVVGSIYYVNVSLDDCSECEVCVSYEDEIPEVVAEEPNTLKVDVKGAVKKPGVYELESGSNIQDAIKIAGGVTSKGSTTNINLSKKLSDEMVVYVFTKDELNKKAVANEVVCEIPKCECETVTVTECPKVNENDGSTSKDDVVNKDTKVSINKATLEEFLTLDGIGESKAKTIIEYRESHGPFEAIEDIQKVSGIGSALYEKIKDRLTL